MIKSKDILALLIIPTLSCQAAHADTSYWPNSFNAALNDIDNYFSEIPEETQHWQAIKTDAYKNINIDNNVRLLIDPKSKNNTMVYYPWVSATVDGDTLTLTSTESTTEKYNVILSSIDNVSTISVKGNSEIKGKGLKHKNKTLDIYTYGSSNVELEGMINLNRLEQASSGTTKLLWVDSKHTTINIYSGVADLAGTTKNANIWAYGNSSLKAAHLRSTNTWISASDNNNSYINPIGYFYAHANKDATIEHRGNYTTIAQVVNNNANLIYKN
ncbi:MAG: hypothetical protein HON78_03300 [Legionellales bacterium]|jgi:hypothetical protein|nr:hypothetical protein [Legionellales bacterium]